MTRMELVGKGMEKDFKSEIYKNGIILSADNDKFAVLIPFDECDSITVFFNTLTEDEVIFDVFDTETVLKYFKIYRGLKGH